MKTELRIIYEAAVEGNGEAKYLIENIIWHYES
jgi:hypothetical protein